MPDWSYRTVLRPALRRLPAEWARTVGLTAIGVMGSTPVGRGVIEFLGHMRIDQRLARTVNGVSFASPMGIGAGLVGDGLGLAGLARFGVGFAELGPVTASAADSSCRVTYGPENEGWRDSSQRVVSLAALQRALRHTPDRSRRSRDDPRVFCRLSPSPQLNVLQAEEWARLIDALAAQVDVFVVPVESPLEVLTPTVAAARGQVPACQVWGLVRADAPASALVGYLSASQAAGVDGYVLDVAQSTDANGLVRGRSAAPAARERLRELRAAQGRDVPMLISGGTSDPADALNWLQEAQLIAIDTGLVDGGPGLPKRINEALLAQTPRRAQEESALPAARRAWFWTLLMGIALFLGGAMSFAIAVSRVVLPYDEDFVQMTRSELAAINPRLLSFMAHDRVSLAGTMLSLGLLYAALSWEAIRRGAHWALRAVQISAFAGFAGFFLFLGFGYFDPFHAFVTAVLFQFLLLSLATELGPTALPTGVDLREDVSWRRAQWGQLLFVIHGAVLITAGLVISSIGATSVFVPQDLEFMALCAADLKAANPRLIPLIAHDRATFGAMLLSTGLTVLTTSLWGFRRGAAWLWWALIVSGGIGYTAAIGVHVAVGYLDPWHLAPAMGGMVVLAASAVLLWPYLVSEARHLP